MHNTLLIAKKDLRGLFSERTLVLTILLQLAIASFSSFLVVGLTSFYDPGALADEDLAGINIGLAYRSEVTLNNSTIRDEKNVNETLLYHLIDESKLSPVSYPDYSGAGSGFYEGEIDGIVLVPNVAINGSDLIEIHIYLPETDFKSTILMLQLKEPLERLERYVREIRTKRLPNYTPIDLNILNLPERSSNHYFEFIYVALIPLLVFTPAFISGGLVIDLITEEFERKTIDLILVTPTTFSELINGKILVATMIVPVQAFTWLLLLSLNGIDIQHILAITLFVTVATFILVLIGAAISIKTKNRGMAQLFYSLILITLFLLCYVFPNSPMNVVTRLAIDSISGTGIALSVIPYLLIASLFYAVFRYLTLTQYRSRYRSGYRR